MIPSVSHVKHDLRAALSHTGTTARPEFPQPASSGSQALVLERQAAVWRSRACPAAIHPRTPLGPIRRPAAHRDDAHPLGCHRSRIPERVVFDKLIQVLVFGCGYRRIADHTCSATTLRRRRDEWITLGLAEQLRLLVLGAYDRLLGLTLTHLAVDGCITKTPCGQTAGPSPVDRAKQGGKRSVAVEADGIPLGAVAAPANRRDDGLLAATLQTLASLGPLPSHPIVHLDAGYDWKPCRDELATRGLVGRIARRGQPAPIQVGLRWVIERTHAWANNYGKERWCTERRQRVVDFWLALTLAIITLGRLIRRAWTHYRWDSRPRRRP